MVQCERSVNAYFALLPLLAVTVIGLDLPKGKRTTGGIGISNSEATFFTWDTLFPTLGTPTLSSMKIERSKSWAGLILQMQKEIQCLKLRVINQITG